ncbi:SDR family oxidoreductase [Acetobacter orleanensis]|uniref:NAD-dependent dehydratase n=1 Tax=Acetobacter orleanensis TaxID=104099 RepID=A0A4Y3TQQ8_9PROT|nr:SDR family oxidoreductase [Acetobacter orleanensis]KXV66977.1 NAD-dependent dehydratase [Acetobacter orleanensis]PCD78344.1 NAD-dependent dehydratase [Acetobacter orleanensis]GAN67549.1 NAD dependent epimerase/dehydratase [Acetobacter orleanensis JCM 7639]GBR28944.1 nucleoside-diphosphate-sugar epimerase [Acetobacter orleanensis NRIC 0473]GEB84073.1 NAD-dependent dehydratase [Acetobacter orleanensis]
MKVFITGANGFVGSAVVSELLSAGHEVLGLARSEEAARAIQAAGAEVLRGSLDNHESLRIGSEKADGVIHLAFNPDFAAFQASCALDKSAIETIGASLVGTSKPLLVPNGIGGLAPGRILTEDDNVPTTYSFPRVSEQTALHLVSQGVIASVIRLSQIHNVRRQGLVSTLIDIARTTGLSAYINDGNNLWPAAHVSDVARLFRIALEMPEAGAKYHAVAEEGIEMRAIATTISRSLGIPIKSLNTEEAQDHFGPLAPFVAMDMPASSDETIKRTGWHPTGPGLLADLEKISRS